MVDQVTKSTVAESSRSSGRCCFQSRRSLEGRLHEVPLQDPLPFPVKFSGAVVHGGRIKLPSVHVCSADTAGSGSVSCQKEPTPPLPERIAPDLSHGASLFSCGRSARSVQLVAGGVDDVIASTITYSTSPVTLQRVIPRVLHGREGSSLECLEMHPGRPLAGSHYSFYITPEGDLVDLTGLSDQHSDILGWSPTTLPSGT